MVDSRFVLKLTDFGLPSFFGSEEEESDHVYYTSKFSQFALTSTFSFGGLTFFYQKYKRFSWYFRIFLEVLGMFLLN